MVVEEPDVREHQSSPEAEDSSTSPSPTSPSLPRPSYHTEMAESTSILPRIDEKTLVALYPPHLKLHLVQVVHRHGHRTPLSYRLPTLIPYYWARCFKADQSTQQIVLEPASGAYSLLAHGNGHDSHHQSQDDDRRHGTLSEASSTDPLGFALSQGHSNQSLFSSHEPSHTRPLMTQTFQMLMENSLAPPHHLDDPQAIPRYASGHCYYGQLTDTGRQLMATFGSYLRTIYIQRLGFLPSSWSAAATRSIYLRSTSYPRTIETLQSVVAGLYPPPSPKHAHAVASVPPIPIYLRMEESETMYPWLKCVRYRELQTQFKKTAHSLLAREMEMTKQKLKNLFNMADPFGAYPSFHGLFDTLYCSKEHGWDIKKSFDVQRKDLASLEHISVKEWFSGFEESEEVVRLGIGRFIKELASVIESKAKSITATAPESFSDPALPRFHIYSGHDTTIAPLLCAFRVFDEKWPPFGSNMTFELLEDIRMREKSKPTDSLYVRLKTNDQVMQMPACQGYYHDSDVSLCQLDRFFEICRAVIPKNLDKECALIPELD